MLVLTDLLSVLVLVANGVVAGALFAVALSVWPALIAMPVDRYVYSHQLLGRRWDPTMPIVVLTSMMLDVALATSAIVSDPPAAVLFGTGGALLLGVAMVSQLGNVPINRVVKSLDPERIPPGWTDPRSRWRRRHLLRTGLALAALAVNATAVVGT